MICVLDVIFPPLLQLQPKCSASRTSGVAFVLAGLTVQYVKMQPKLDYVQSLYPVLLVQRERGGPACWQGEADGEQYPIGGGRRRAGSRCGLDNNELK